MSGVYEPRVVRVSGGLAGPGLPGGGPRLDVHLPAPAHGHHAAPSRGPRTNRDSDTCL